MPIFFIPFVQLEVADSYQNLHANEGHVTRNYFKITALVKPGYQQLFEPAKTLNHKFLNQLIFVSAEVLMGMIMYTFLFHPFVGSVIIRPMSYDIAAKYNIIIGHSLAPSYESYFI